MKDQLKQNEEYKLRLIDFIHSEYNLTADSIIPAKRGYNGETWKLNTKKNSYFIKIVSSNTHKFLYKRSFSVIEHINNHGINFISKIVKTVFGDLFTYFEGATVGVFNWIDGDNVQDENTKIPEYNMLATIYTVPTAGLKIPCEEFNRECVDLFYNQLNELKNRPNNKVNDSLLKIFETNKDKFEKNLSRLNMFSILCRSDLSHQYITHGDAGGNIMMNSNSFFIVDWDDPVIAPPERDAWFCIHFDWAMKGFNEALRNNGIDYVLRPERLAYYCYYSFFWYLTKYMGTYLESGKDNNELVTEIMDYIQNSWINSNIKYVEDNYKH